jgi:hypothetical protein
MGYPGGYIWFTLMDRVPGDDVDEIRHELTRPQRHSIRVQLTTILREMGRRNRVLRTEHPSFLRYDRESSLFLPHFFGLASPTDTP